MQQTPARPGSPSFPPVDPRWSASSQAAVSPHRAIVRPCRALQRRALSEGSELHACRSTLSPVSCSRIACPSLLFILLPLPAFPSTVEAVSSLRSRSCRRGEGDSSFITLQWKLLTSQYLLNDGLHSLGFKKWCYRSALTVLSDLWLVHI